MPPLHQNRPLPIFPRLRHSLRLRLVVGVVLLLLSVNAVLLVCLNLAFRWMLDSDLLALSVPAVVQGAGDTSTTNADDTIFVQGVAVVPEAAVATLQRLSGIGFGAVVVGGGVGVYLIAHYALAPLATMRDEARRVKQARLGARLTLPSDPDELYEVAVGFNQVLEQLEQGLRRQGHFLDEVAHELRTPLMLLQCQLDEASMEPARHEACQQTLHRLHHLIENLLHLAQAAEPFVPAPLDLTPLAESVITTLDTLAEHHRVTLVLEVPDRTLVMGNDTLLGVAVSNLVENGILYNQPGGWVRVDLKVEGEAVIVQVQDNGVGIPHAALPHIFERFFRVNLNHPRTVPASGLGLAIAAEIVTHHRGTLTVESIAGKGTTFTMRLPHISVTG